MLLPVRLRPAQVAAQRRVVAVRGQGRVHLLELRRHLLGQRRVHLLQTGLEVGEGLLGALDVVGEVHQVEVAELLLLAGDLVRLHLLQQAGGAVGEILRLVVEGLHDLQQLADVGDQVGGVLLRGGGDLAGGEQVALDGVVAHPAHLVVQRGGAHVDAVVQGARGVVQLEAGQDEALDVGLDLLVERTRLRVGRLRLGQVAGVDRAGQRLHRGLHLLGLGDHPRRVVGRALGQQLLGASGRGRGRVPGDRERHQFGGRAGAVEVVAAAAQRHRERGRGQAGGEVLLLAEDLQVALQLHLGDPGGAHVGDREGHRAGWGAGVVEGAGATPVRGERERDLGRAVADRREAVPAGGCGRRAAGRGGGRGTGTAGQRDGERDRRSGTQRPIPDRPSDRRGQGLPRRHWLPFWRWRPAC